MNDAKVESLIRQYLPAVNVMQLATSVDGQPWICTVHFYSDESLNFYWSSNRDRRHSQDIEQNQNVACYVLVHENTSEENYVIGISVEGTAKFVGTNVDVAVSQAYVNKLQKEADPSREFYSLKPTKIVLFDNKNFPDQARQEFNIA